MTHRADLNLLVGRNKDEILIAVNTKYAETRRCGRTRDQLLWNCYLIEYRDNEEEEKKEEEELGQFFLSLFNK